MRVGNFEAVCPCRGGGLIRVALAIAALILSPVYISVCAQTGADQQQHCQEYDLLKLALIKGGDALVSSAFWTAAATVAIAAFTLRLKHSTDKLWDASERQHALLQDQIDLTFRPRIRVRHIWLTKDIWGGERVEFTVVVVNVGTAEAFLLEIGVSTFVLGTHKKLPADPTLREVGKFNLALTSLRGGQSLDFGDMNDWRVLTETQRIDIFQGKASLYCVGYISYQDRRGGLRKTSFCRVLEAPRKPESGALGRFVKCDDPDYEYED